MFQRNTRDKVHLVLGDDSHLTCDIIEMGVNGCEEGIMM